MDWDDTHDDAFRWNPDTVRKIALAASEEYGNGDKLRPAVRRLYLRKIVYLTGVTTAQVRNKSPILSSGTIVQLVDECTRSLSIEEIPTGRGCVFNHNDIFIVRRCWYEGTENGVDNWSLEFMNRNYEGFRF